MPIPIPTPTPRYSSSRVFGRTVTNAPECADCENCFRAGGSPILFNLEVNTDQSYFMSGFERLVAQAGWFIKARCIRFELPLADSDKTAAADEPLPTCVNFEQKNAPVPLPSGTNLVAQG